MSWADNNGNLWLFGGYGYDINSSRGYLNDLWKYNTSNGKWTWVSGSSESNQANIWYKGSYSSANIPGARDSALTWIDASGNLWLFGGCVTVDQFNCSLINDLWEYNITTNQWRWVSGYDTPNQPGNYGSLKFHLLIIYQLLAKLEQHGLAQMETYGYLVVAAAVIIMIYGVIIL